LAGIASEKHRELAIFRLSIDGVELGELLDMYSAATRYDNTFSFGKKQFDSPGAAWLRN
jgi:hypothetical protein